MYILANQASLFNMNHWNQREHFKILIYIKHHLLSACYHFRKKNTEETCDYSKPAQIGCPNVFKDRLLCIKTYINDRYNFCKPPSHDLKIASAPIASV